MKRLFLLLVGFIFVLTTDSEALLNVVIIKEANIDFVMDKQPGKLVYNAADPGWQIKSYARFRVTGNANAPVTVTIPATVALSQSPNTATAAVVGRCKLGSYATSSTDGSDCSTGISIGPDGVLFISVFPTSNTLNQDLTGTYVGPLTIMVVY